MSALKERILRLIRAQGPMGVAQYTQMALTDRDHGYYMRRDPFGRRGDFITAPEVSQIFGELIGLFFVQAWEDRRRPERFHFVELGPGRGTLMADMLRAAAKVRPGFTAAAHVMLVEASPALRAIQAKTLADRAVEWAVEFSAVPDNAPLFLVANEFFDALPVRQFVRSERGWHERMIGAEGKALRFLVAPDPVPADFVPKALRDARAGAIYETSPSAQALMREIARRIASQGGLALVIDYGHASPGLGDTLQAVKAHKFADSLAEPGDADLTFHVDFSALADAVVEREETQLFGPTPQGSFLERLGIGARAAQLKRSAPDRADEIDAGVDRLVNPQAMGSLFKVMAVSDGCLHHPEGFACSS